MMLSKLTNKDELEAVAASRISKQTAANNQWALNRYTLWAQARNAITDDLNEHVPTNFLRLEPPRYNWVLSRFIKESTDASGTTYSFATLYQLIAALNRTVKEIHPGMDLLSSPNFRQFRNVADGIIKQRQAEDSSQRRKVSTIGYNEENKLWEKAFLLTDAHGLQAAMIYCTQKAFGLRAQTELYNFSLDQVKVVPAGQGPGDTIFSVTFCEKFSKNYAPGLKGVSSKKRVVEFQEDSEDPRSFLHVISLYLTRCPPTIQCGAAPFFQHVNNNWKSEEFWYGQRSRIGVNYFPKIMKTAYNKAGLEGDYTLRSVRAGVVQELVQMGLEDEGTYVHHPNYIIFIYFS